MKKLLLILLVLGLTTFLIVGCNVATPAEGEGEGEGEGEEEVARVVLVELFNSSGCVSCSVVEPYLEEIALDAGYGRDKMVLVEEAGWGLNSTPETSARYKWYLPNSGDRGTPNILINGLNKKYHGDSGVNKSILMSKIDAQSNLEAKIKITATKTINAISTIVSGNVTNISTSDLGNLVVTLMTYKNRAIQGFKYSVTNIVTEQIGSLTSSGTYAFSLTVNEPNWNINGLDGVVLVQETGTSKKEVLQAFYVD